MTIIIRKLREQRGWTKSHLSRLLGVSRQQIDKLEAPDRRLNEAWLNKLSKVFNVPPTDLMSSPGASATPSVWPGQNPPLPQGVKGLLAEPRAQYMPPSQQNLVPVYGQASCGPDGQFEMNGQIVDHQRRPWSLENVPDAYALYVEGTSMHPRFKEGEVVYVHPGRKPRIEDDVVVQLQPLQDGEPPRAFIKEYRGGDLVTITLRQYGDDPKDFTIQRDEIVSIHKIVGRGEPA